MINRHNYEEYFLLYADDELSHRQRAEVELFVQENPDMAAELEMIVQMKLEPEEHVVFPDKSMLFKTTDVEININNYEEFFLLYIDQELDEAANGKVEKFVLQHPQLQEEFTLLKQTVLKPEAITFADKSTLYRKEERRVAYMGFERLAAAAAFIGLVLLGWWLYPKTGDGGLKQSVAQGPTVVHPVTPHVGPKLPIVTPPVVGQQQNDVTAQAAGVKKINKAQTPATTQKAGNDVQQQPVTLPTVEDNVVALNTKNQPNNQEAPTTIATNTAGVENGVNAGIVVPVQPLASLLEQPTADVAEADPHKGKTPEDPIEKNRTQAPVAQTVAYKEIDTNEDDRSMYVGSLELNKDKIKGFFKRAGRLFGARPKKDTD